MRGSKCRQLFKRKTLAGFLTANGLDTQFTDDSGHMLSLPVLWSLLLFIRFSSGEKANKLKFQSGLPCAGALVDYQG